MALLVQKCVGFRDTRPLGRSAELCHCSCPLSAPGGSLGLCSGSEQKRRRKAVFCSIKWCERCCDQHKGLSSGHRSTRVERHRGSGLPSPDVHTSLHFLNNIYFDKSFRTSHAAEWKGAGGAGDQSPSQCGEGRPPPLIGILLQREAVQPRPTGASDEVDTGACQAPRDGQKWVCSCDTNR